MYQSVTASAPGRVCFAGEDIDWILGPALLGAVDLRIKVRVTALAENCDFILLKTGNPFNTEHRISLSNIGKYKKHILDYVEGAVKVISNRGVKITPIEINVSSDFPPQAGLSSSAAVTVASLNALAKFYDLSLSTYEICDLAYSIEKDELKTGAGQMDFYVCGLGGVLYLDSANRPPSPVEQYTLPSDIAIIVADTMTPRNTGDIIRGKRLRLAQSESGIISYIKHTKTAIDEIRHLFKQPSFDLKQFGALVIRCHDYLDKYMRVSTDTLNKCVELCLINGAVGAKLTGTGMGGCMFAIVPPSLIIQIKKDLSPLPVTIYETNISSCGTIIEQTVKL